MKTKTWKKLSVLLIVLFLSSLAAFTAAACKKKDGVKIEYYLSADLEGGDTDVGTSVVIPDAVVKDKDGNVVEREVSVAAYNHIDAMIATSKTTLRFTEAGTWRIVYSAEGAEDLEIVFAVKDLSAPEVKVSGVNTFVRTGHEYPMPSFEYKDYSGMDFTKTEIRVEFCPIGANTWTDYPYKKTTNTYKPQQEGFYRITLKAVDASAQSNAGNYSWTTLAVDEGWRIPELERGTLAAYDSDIYTYLVTEGGAGGAYWAGASLPAVEYVSEGIAGAADGDALKVSVERGANGAHFRLVVPASDSDWMDGVERLYLRYKGNVSINFINYDDEQTTVDEYNLARQNACVVTPPDENGWQYMEIPKHLLTADSGDPAFGNLSHIDILTVQSGEFYFDFLKGMTALPAPDGLSVSGGTAEWNAVAGADGYEVWINGAAFRTAETSFALTGAEEYMVRVKALGDDENTVSSEWSAPALTVTMSGDDIFPADDAVYAWLLRGDNAYGGEYWNPAAFQATYDAQYAGATDGAVRVAMTSNTADGKGLWRFAFDLPAELDETRVVLVRYKTTVPITWNSVAYNGNQGPAHLNRIEGECWSIADDGEWKIMAIPAGKFPDGVVSLSFAGQTPGMNAAFEFVLDYVIYGKQFDAPVLSYGGSGTVSWAAVEGADSYSVEVDGQVAEAAYTGATYRTDGIRCVRVKVNGKGNSVASEWSDAVYTDILEENEILPADAAAYRYAFRATDGYGGAYWDAANFTAEYDEAEQFVRLTFRGNANNVWRVGMEFARPAAIGAGSVAVLRFKSDLNITAYAYNGEQTGNFNTLKKVTIADDGNTGWKLLIIADAFDVSAPLYDLMLAGSLNSGGNGEILVDWIRYGEKLPSPVPVFDGANVSWQAVENATEYQLEIDGEILPAPVSGTTYAPSGVHVVRVRAAGTGAYLASDWSDYVLTDELGAGEIFPADSEAYKYLFRGDNSYGGGWWDPASFSASFDGNYDQSTNGAVVLNITANSNESEAGLWRFTFELPAAFDETKPLLIRYKAPSSLVWGDVAYNGFVDGNLNFIEENCWTLSADGEWTLMSIPADKFPDGVTSIVFAGRAGKGESFEFALDYVKYDRKFPAPQGVSYDADSGKIVWDAVSGAEEYVVKLGSEVFDATENAYSVGTLDPGVHAVCVMAKGNGEFGDSPWSETAYIVSSASDGLLPIDHEAYERFIVASGANGSWGGDWWSARNFTAEYDPDYAGADAGAIVVNFTVGADGSGRRFVATFPKAFAPSGKTVVMRFKGDVTFDSIGFNGNQGTPEGNHPNYTSQFSVIQDGDTGWNLLVIAGGLPDSVYELAFALAAPSGANVGLAIDWIEYREALSAPALSWDGTNLSWTDVGAEEYVVETDGVQSVATGTSLDVSGVRAVRVKARSSSALESDWSNLVVTSDLEGKIVSYNHETLKKMFRSTDVYGGNWWLAAEVEVGYDATEGAMKVTLTPSTNGTASFIALFPQAVTPSENFDIRFRTDSEISILSLVGQGAGNHGVHPDSAAGFQIKADADTGWKIATVSNWAQVGGNGVQVTPVWGIGFNFAGSGPITVWLDYIASAQQ